MMRFRRSLLYVPGDRPDRMRKAMGLPADSVVFDLEDAVAPAAKANARNTVKSAVGLARTDRPSGAARATPEICVRVNPVGTEWHDEDVAMVVAARPDAVVLPKAERAEDVRELGAKLHGMPLIVLVETAEGVLQAASIAKSAQSLVAVVFGSEDFAADVGLVRTRGNTEVLYARSRVALAAAAARIQAIDQVYVDYKDPEGLHREAAEGRGLGFVGKQIIHPDQIEPVHRAFTPSKEEAEKAQRLLDAAEKAGGAAFGFEGRMIDRPLVEQAKRVVGLARHAGVL